MNVVRGWVLTMFVFAVGCASAPPPPPPPPPPAPIVVEAEQQPFPEPPPPPDQPPPPDEPTRPLQVDGGKHRISVASERTEDEAAQWVKRAGELGYRAEVESVDLDGVTWHRVVLPGYATRDDAINALGFADGDFGVVGSWRVGRPGAAPPPAPPAEPDPDSGDAPTDDDN